MGKLRISTCMKYRDQYICFAKDVSLLFELNLNGKTKGLCLLPEQEIDRRCQKLLLWNDKVIMVPLSEEKIYLYDYNSRDLSYIDIPEDRKKTRCKFFNGFIIDNSLYLIGAFYPGILKVNLIEKSVEEIDVYKKLYKRQIELGDCFTRKSILKEGNNLLIPSSISNEILVFDTNTDKYIWRSIGGIENRYCGIERVDGNYWIAPRYGTNLLIINAEGAVEEIDLADYCSPNYNFSGIVLKGDTVVLYSLNLGFSLEIDKYTKHIRKIRSGIDVMLEKTEGEILSQIDGGDITKYYHGKEETIRLELTTLYRMIFRIEKESVLYPENEMIGLSDFINEYS